MGNGLWPEGTEGQLIELQHTLQGELQQGNNKLHVWNGRSCPV